MKSRNGSAGMRLNLQFVATFLLSGSAPMCGWAEIRISHGPILGRVSSDGIGIWARTSEPGAD
jgi:hypothetical protein